MNDEERQSRLAHLAQLKAQGEAAYDAMYEAHSFGSATACYSDAKECFISAIALAEELELGEEADTLAQRLDRIKAVFRSQFTQ